MAKNQDRRPRTRSWWPTPAGREALAEHRRLCQTRFVLTYQGWRALAGWEALAERAAAAPSGRS